MSDAQREKPVAAGSCAHILPKAEKTGNTAAASLSLHWLSHLVLKIANGNQGRETEPYCPGESSVVTQIGGPD